MGVLRVATWNVLAEQYLHADRYPHLAVLPDADLRRRAVRRIVGELAGAVDLIALQEVEEPLADALRSDLAGHDIRWSPLGAGRTDGLLLAVPQTLGASFAADGETTDPSARRVALVARLPIDGALLTVACVHLNWSPVDSPAHRGIRQAKAIVGVLAGVQRALILGDLNDFRGGPVLAAIADGGFEVVSPETATAVINRRGPVIIDHLAVRGASVRDVRTVEAADRPLPDDRCPSDHVPVMGTVGIIDV